jgi:hypothetical protein
MGWGVPYLLPWALNDTRKSPFQGKEQKKKKKKVPWAVEYQNDGLSWISPGEGGQGKGREHVKWDMYA